MSALRKFACVLCLSVFAAAGGCAVADTGSFVRLQEEVEGLRQEVAAAKRNAAAPQPAAQGIQESAAPLRANPEEILSLRQELADLANNLDSTRSEVRAAGTRIDESKVEMRKEISRLNSKTDEGAIAIQELKAHQAKLQDVDRRLASLEERLEKALPPSGRGGSQGAGQSAVPQEWKSAEDMYDYALGTLKGGETAKARTIFESFGTKYPGHKLSPNVLYWRGESFYVDKDYENAIIAFQDVIDKYPASDKASDGMFKQGLSFLALQDKKNAKTLFELLASKYPKSPAAEKARQKLTEIK
ncbi:MAG TPA: tol-pal system protein YbgF [Candidatus Deferrimicrobiaceae bacterium]